MWRGRAPCSRCSHMLGRFLEISVYAPELLESLAFYERLGFTQAAVGETWSHPYAVVTDGRLFIGLHRYEFPSPSLTFVQPDLVNNLERLEGLGIELAFRRVGADVFNEAGFVDPNGQMVTLLEARTFSPPARRGHETSRLGWFEEFALPSQDLDASARYWEQLGFVAVERAEQPWPRAGLTSDTLNVALVGGGHLRRPALVFRETDMPERVQRLRESGLDFERQLPQALDPRQSALLIAPEGTPLLLLAD
jgi:catechol 2,3-dioxygenase-like lactoylglutathione lyase family enzyme